MNLSFSINKNSQPPASLILPVIKKMSAVKTTKKGISATLVIVTPVKGYIERGEHDYNILLLKRSDKTAVMPNQSVFPGGLLTPEADESIEWLQYFKECGITQQALRQLVLIDTDRPSVLAPQGTGCYDRFFKRSSIWAREISLRINALRETFEEVGILICRKLNNLQELNTSAATYFEEHFDRVHWQQRVHADPHEFLRMCRSLRVVPDLWALYEWSAWQSPAVLRKSYETAFFITFLTAQPQLLAEPKEVKACMWHTPTTYLRLFRADEILMLPPQFYELSRLVGVKSYQALQAFARQRSAKGSTLFFPILYTCNDTVLGILPGDDYYTADPQQVTEPMSYHGTAEEFRARTKRIHRYENARGTNIQIYLNFEPFNGHLVPKACDFEKHKL